MEFSTKQVMLHVKLKAEIKPIKNKIKSNSKFIFLKVQITRHVYSILSINSTVLMKEGNCFLYATNNTQK